MKITLIMLLCLMSCTTADNIVVLRCTVSRVIDGDTFVCKSGDTIRLAGINAPELDEHYGQESYEVLRDIIDNEVVWLHITGKGYYGRTIAYTYYNSIDISEHLLRNGYAKYSKYDHRFYDSYISDQRYAEVYQKGIWEY